MSKDNRGRSAHADGGAAGVKKRFSLAARHRFFGQAPKKWGRKAGQANDNLPTYRRTRTSVKKKGGTPGEGSPLDPLLRFCEQKGDSALCGARPEALPLDSTTFEKVDETFRRAHKRAGPQKGGPGGPPFGFTAACRRSTGRPGTSRLRRPGGPGSRIWRRPDVRGWC